MKEACFDQLNLFLANQNAENGIQLILLRKTNIFDLELSENEISPCPYLNDLHIDFSFDQSSPDNVFFGWTALSFCVS